MGKCVPLPYEEHEIENPTVQVVHKVDNTIHQGQVVQKPVDINPGLNINCGFIFLGKYVSHL